MADYMQNIGVDAFEFWAFVAGLGVFLFGMSQIELGLKALAGRKMKLYLKKQTNTTSKGILAGTFSTAILQSSSVVLLMVLAFVGAGVLPMKNALGIILGSNLGTTLTGWIVATLGFKADLEVLALPLIGIGSFGILIFSDEQKRTQYFKIIIGFGFLLFGLNLMKQSMEQLSGALDVQLLQGYSPIFFLVAGMVFTAIIQSSSATMMITLSALHSGMIDLHSAAALVIGADLGTTGTVLLGAAKGSAEKKQVAAGHFIFNLITDVLAFLLLPLLLYLLSSVLSLKDPLYTLVAFHSGFNLVGILIFTPFVDRFAKFLEPRFRTSKDKISKYLSIEITQDPDAAAYALKKESQRILESVLVFNSRTLKIEPPVSNGVLGTIGSDQGMAKKQYSEQYELLKTLEGEILAYVMKVQLGKVEEKQGEELQKYLSSVRNTVAAAKCLKDVRHNLVNFRHSSRDQINNYYLFLKDFMMKFYQELNDLRDVSSGLATETLLELHKNNDEFHNEFLKRIYADVGQYPILEVDLSTLLNVNRELFTSNRNLLKACEFLYLNSEDDETNDVRKQ